MAITDTDWKKIEIVGGDGDRDAAGVVEPVTGLEARPCLACRSFENDRTRLIQHLISRGLKADERGHFETPIAKDFKGRRSLKIDPRNFGYCRKNTEVVEMTATCPAWRPVRTVEDLAGRIR